MDYVKWQILEPNPQKYFNKLDCIILDDMLVNLLFCWLCYIWSNLIPMDVCKFQNQFTRYKGLGEAMVEDRFVPE